MPARVAVRARWRWDIAAPAAYKGVRRVIRGMRDETEKKACHATSAASTVGQRGVVVAR